MKNRAVSILSIALVIVSVMLVIVSFNKAVDNANQPTLRDILSKPTPMTSSYEVVDVVNGEYHLVDVSLDGNDQGTFILEGDYEIGDVITIMYSDTTMEEVTGEVKVGEAKELDK